MPSESDKLDKILAEMLATEVTYFGNLQAFIYEVAEDLNNPQLNQQRVIIEKLIAQSSEFLRSLPKPPTPTTTKDVVNFFKSHPDYLDLHAKYIERFDPNVFPSTHSATAIMPVQRLPRYVLLLQEIANNTDDAEVGELLAETREKTRGLNAKMTTMGLEKGQRIQFLELISKLTGFKNTLAKSTLVAAANKGRIAAYEGLILRLTNLIPSSLFKNNDPESIQERTEIIAAVDKFTNKYIDTAAINNVSNEITAIERSFDTPDEKLLAKIKKNIEKKFIQPGFNLSKDAGDHAYQEKLWESACAEVLKEMNIPAKKLENTMHMLNKPPLDSKEGLWKGSCFDKFNENRSEKNIQVAADNLKAVQARSRVLPERVEPFRKEAILHLQRQQPKKPYTNTDYLNTDYVNEYNRLGTYMSKKPTANENIEKSKDFASELRAALISLDIKTKGEKPSEEKAFKVKAMIKEYQSENNVPKELNNILKDITRQINKNYPDINKYVPPEKPKYTK